MAVPNTTNNDQVFQKTVQVTQFANTNTMMVDSSTTGLLGATKLLIPAMIVDGTVITNLENAANWNVSFVYIGTTITGCYQGQMHYNATYLYLFVEDNVPIRLARI